MGDKKKLSICMMVKNEEKHLEKSLLSLKPLFDNLKTELIIVDTGSEDSTVEIAKKYTRNVYFHEWNNNFGEMRNKTIKYAKGEWILILDADEIFHNITPLVDFLKSPISSKYNTGTITIKSITTEDNEDIHQAVDILRLFRNTKSFCYKGSIHEQPQFQPPVYFTNAEVLHYGYLSTDKELMEYKFKRNVELLKKELEEDPENIYNWFQLAQSYGMHKDFKKSLEIILKAYELIKKDKGNKKNYLFVYNYLARAYFHNEKFIEVERTCLEALEMENGFIDFYYYLGVAQSHLKKDKKAIENFKQYLDIRERYQNSKSDKYLTLTKGTLGLYEEVYLSLCILYKRIENKEQALKYAQKIKKDYMLKRSIPHLVELYIELEKYEELKEEYNKILDKEEEIVHIFWISLENVMVKQEEEKKEKLIQLFSTGDEVYSLLNKARLSINENKEDIKQEFINKLKEIDFQSLPAFFADIIYLLLRNGKVAVGEILYNLRDHSIQSYIQYLINKYEEELSNILIQYLDKMKNNRSFNEIKIQKVLKKAILVLDRVEDEKYKQVWDSYIQDGRYYIYQIYNKNIIENEMIYDVKDEEDAFLLYMSFAEKEKDEVLYVRYLRKALKVYPSMKKGIELLFKQIKEEVNAPENNIEFISEEKQSEFDEYKQMVKNNINLLIEAKKIGEAKLLIDEYLQIIPNDLEMLTLKSEIQLQLM